MAQNTNWKLTLAYDGSSFHGWQIQSAQSGLATIQGTLRDALERLTGEHVLPQGSGRTDAGVHALAQVVTFRLAAPVPAANLRRALNRILPASIRVFSAEEVPPSFHARHSARSKTYEYRIFERRIRRQPGQLAEERICAPFLASYAWDCRWPLSLDAMQQAAALLVGTHDFTSMAASDPERSLRDPERARAQRDAEDDVRDEPQHALKINPVKTITRAEWSRLPASHPMALGPWPSGPAADGLLLFQITGSGFLHHMVRNLVGTLVEIGRGSLEVADLPRILAARDRTAAGPTAPARGLYLVEVVYGESPADNECPTSRRDVGSQDAEYSTLESGCPTSRRDVGSQDAEYSTLEPGCPTSRRDVGSQDAEYSTLEPGCPTSRKDVGSQDAEYSTLEPGCPTSRRDVGSQDAEYSTLESGCPTLDAHSAAGWGRDAEQSEHLTPHGVVTSQGCPIQDAAETAS